YLMKHKQYFSAAEVFKKIGDIKKLAMIYVKSCQWEEAFKLVNEYPELREEVYVPYATWLAENDRFVESQQAFHKAGKVNEALRVLLQLTNNAINERRFNDAAYYNWILSMQCLDQGNEAESEALRQRFINKFTTLQRKADIYYAYHNIYRYIEEPFTSFFPDALFNMARFVFHLTLNNTPEGVSKVSILYALAKQGRNLGAYKLTRLVYEKLHSLLIPPRFQDAIELGDLTIRAKPFSDAEVRCDAHANNRMIEMIIKRS
ncbi:intraflagellar transport protein 122-like protein, partial [Leptotrombidium deliense]